MSERLQPSKPEFAACTIIAKNYLPMARVLYESWNAFHPDCPLYVLLLDSPWVFFDPEAEPFQFVLVPELDIPNLNGFLFKYALLEASTATKPYFLTYLFRRYSIDKLLYLDPDILILNSLDGLKHSLDDANVLLTPHLLSPLPDDGHRQTEHDILKSGAFNLGFLGLRNGPASQQLLRWWCGKLYHYCVVAIEDSLFVDQKWMDLVPGMFDGVRILRDPGYNVAYWNLHERSVSVTDRITVNSRPLYFFHFSGFDPDKPEIVSKFQDRFQMEDIGDARKIYDNYRLLLIEKGWNQTKGWKYDHDFFRDGAAIPRWARRYYWSLGTDVIHLGDPFSQEIRVQVFPFGETGYSEESSLIQKMKVGTWSTLIFELPEGTGRGSLRVDPADQPCFVELGDILIHSHPAGELLWSSSAASRMGSLGVSGTAVLLSGERGSYLLSVGDDPQVMLMTPDLPGALKLTISLRVSFTPYLVPEVVTSLVEAGQARAAEQVTAAQCERDAMANELGQVKPELIQARTELTQARTELAQARTELTQRERREQSMQELQRRSTVLEQIQNSHGWKALSLDYRLRNKLIPERMTRIVKEGVSLLRDIRLVSASGLFDREWYLRRNPDVAQAGVSPLRHYLRRGALEGRDPNMLFDSDWYLTQYPDVAKAGMNPLVHYLRHGANEGRDPSPHFDTDWYLSQYPDVAKAGVNPLRHFLLCGAIEQRDPSPLFNTTKYLQMHPEVALAKLNPFARFSRSGRSHLPVPTDDSIGPPAGDPKLMGVEPSGNLWAALNSSQSPPEQEDSSYDSIATLLHSSYRSRLDNLVLPRPEAFSVGDHEYTQCAAALEFRHAAAPLVSIVIPVCNKLRYTLECLTSISRHSDGMDYEVVVIDDGSSDATPDILSRIANLVYVRNDQNLGFIRSCNRGAEKSRGKYILFFNNDAQATRGWLRPLIETFDRHANVGAVGPKILYPSGRLQEAGALVNHDGTSTLVGLFDDPSLPQYNRLREVPYCSGVCLALERKTFLDIGGFDEELAPAYCEDCDLSFRLRRLGLRVIYNPEAVVLHHLSVTSGALLKATAVVNNQQKLAERWQREIDELNEVKLIAFYLPQFHPIPENDRWWGKGFTEWTNVAKARPNYFGHYQPHLPADLGFYDLRLDAVREQQGLLARRYGIYGFCYYYYWFAGKRLLEEPLERMLETNKPDVPFCLMWANENWTRRWDGHEKHVLIAQEHSDEDDLAVMQDLIRYLKHRNYIRVNGRPLLIVYRVSLFPSILRTTEIWRELCHKEGIGDIYLAMAESFEYTRSSVNPASLGFDASVEFPPHGMYAPIPPPGTVMNPKFNGVIHDYRQAVADELQRPKPAHVRFRSAIPAWDNTARRQDDPVMFEHTSPGAYQAWLEAIIESTRQYNFGDERLVFINAWNEWAEGNHLEPDKRNGHAFLEATLKAKQAWLWHHTIQW